MCKSLTNYFPRNNDFLVIYLGKTQNFIALEHEVTQQMRRDKFYQYNGIHLSLSLINSSNLFTYILINPSLPVLMDLSTICREIPSMLPISA